MDTNKITTTNFSTFISYLKPQPNYQDVVSKYNLSSLRFLTPSDLIGDNETILNNLKNAWKLTVNADAANYTMINIYGRASLQFS